MALLPACATQVPPDDPVYQRIGELQHQVDQLQRLVKGQQFMGVVSDQQQLQRELSALRGQIQTLQHEFQQSRQRQQAINRNFDQRLAQLGGGSPAVFQGGSTGAAAGGTAASGGQDNSAQGGAAPTRKVSDSTAYRAAFDKLRAGNNGAAVVAFQAFIQNYPNSSLVPNAWYWMAETHYVNGEYKKAIDNFREVLSDYPNSAKAPDAYLKIGYAQYALGEYDQARDTFKAVIRKYPGTTPADLAQRRLQKMGAQG
ncbi:MAG: tol-pal system protein YbgF [Gammaproteobacteria bacterium]|nr:tol-pal system protein YbgF [Gammaproteobacteria bacterium]